VCVCVCVCKNCFRRIRELNENNTKKFIEERKRQAVIQSRQMELLHKLHQDQADKLRTEMNSVLPVQFCPLKMKNVEVMCLI